MPYARLTRRSTRLNAVGALAAKNWVRAQPHTLAKISAAPRIEAKAWYLDMGHLPIHSSGMEFLCESLAPDRRMAGSLRPRIRVSDPEQRLRTKHSARVRSDAPNCLSPIVCDQQRTVLILRKQSTRWSRPRGRQCF